MRFSNELQVKLDEKGRPLAFYFRGGTACRAPTYANGSHPVNYKVLNILSWWREPGNWWEGEPVTLYLRLQASLFYEPKQPAPRVFEICRKGEKWYLHRLLG